MTRNITDKQEAYNDGYHDHSEIVKSRLILSRELAKEFAKAQFDGRTPATNPKVVAFWHYSEVEIEELLDQIFGVDSSGNPVLHITPLEESDHA